MVNNARIKRASIDSSWLRLIDAVPTVVEVAEVSNSRTLPSVHFPRQHNIVRGSSLPGEAIMICIDTSDWMQNKESPRFKEQADAIRFYCTQKFK
ncbi:hypothetical protein Tco_0110212, partial [Tanacetum coccineum]